MSFPVGGMSLTTRICTKIFGKKIIIKAQYDTKVSSDLTFSHCESITNPHSFSNNQRQSTCSWPFGPFTSLCPSGKSLVYCHLLHNPETNFSYVPVNTVNCFVFWVFMGFLGEGWEGSFWLPERLFLFLRKFAYLSIPHL